MLTTATNSSNLDKIGHFDYIAQNMGYSIAAVAAYLFLNNYFHVLIYLDLFTTFLSTIGYFYYYNLLNNMIAAKSKKSSNLKCSNINYLSIWKKLVGMGILASVLTFHIVLLPSIYKSSGLDLIKYQAITFLVNAILVITVGWYVSSILKHYSKYSR